MLSLIGLTPEEKRAVEEVLSGVPEPRKLTGSFTVGQIGQGKRGFDLSRRGEKGTLLYGDRISLMRAVGRIAVNRDKTEYDVREAPRYDLLGAMPDASRNAVPTVGTVKRYLRILAAEGINALMLYTEDTYELEGYPYFGHLRGRYTDAEIREIDDYADLLGIELIPCIQTLAHLNAFFEWPDSERYHDCNDILLVGEEKVYEMIDRMLATCEKNFRSRKINIGMDEAHMLGAGKFKDREGDVPRFEIMLRHLSRVAELCKKHGFEPRMWSDMFFRILNHGVYRVKGTVIPQEIVDAVPENVTLTYWDYYQVKVENYDELFRQHKTFKNPIAFAGGDSSWYGQAPLNRCGRNSAIAAVESIEKNEIKEIYVTSWKDDGAACSHFSSLVSLFLYAEADWRGRERMEEDARSAMPALTGLDYDELLSLEDLNDLPGRKKLGEVPANPIRYVLYENILQGKFDCHIPKGSGRHFAKEAERLSEIAERGGEWAYFYRTLEKLARVLSHKAEMGKRLTEYYLAGDRERVREIADTGIPDLIGEIREYHDEFRRQWLKENKTFGFDVMDIRIGGVIAQLESAEVLLGEWLSGDRERIDDLEAPRLPYDGKGNKGFDSEVLWVNRWERMAAQNISNMF